MMGMWSGSAGLRGTLAVLIAVIVGWEGAVWLFQPPIIILTRSQSFFAPTDINSYANIFVKDADVRMYDGSQTYVIPMFCSSQLPPEVIDSVAALTGLDPALLSSVDVCIYTSLDPNTYGVIGRSYRLTINAEGKTLTSTTHIPNPVPLDSLWFQLTDQNDGDDTSGFIWASAHDPDTAGNYYRVQTRRLNRDEDGNPKDPVFVAPFGSTSSDDFFNGINVQFVIIKGSSAYATDLEDAQNIHFMRDDTVEVKLISMDKREYDFYRSFETNVSTQGDLFTTPTNVISNIDGGLGVWAGLSSDRRTVVCVPVQ